MEEIWKDIPEYEGYYQVSNLGRVKRLKGIHKEDHILVNKTKSNGYQFVCFSKNNKLKYFHIHRLVSAAFIPNPDNKPCVNHKNLIKSDNCVENLEWVTFRENSIHKVKNLVIDYNVPKLSKHYAAQQVAQMNFNGEILYVWDCLTSAGRHYNTSHGCIGIATKNTRGRKTSIGFRWKKITMDEYNLLKCLNPEQPPVKGKSNRAPKHFVN